MPTYSKVCTVVFTCLHQIHPCSLGQSLHSHSWTALSYKPPIPLSGLSVPILSHSINSFSCELLNVMILYNLPPSLLAHYKQFFTTTGQSVPATNFGLSPLGCSHCALPLTFCCRFPSSVIKPKYSSCRLYDACRIANNQVSAILLHSVSYSVAFDRL